MATTTTDMLKLFVVDTVRRQNHIMDSLVLQL